MVCLHLIFTVAVVLVSGRLANGGSQSSTSIIVNTSGSGTSESRVKGPDGVTAGHCSYNDLNGHHVEIKYKETASGEVTIQPDSKFTGDGKEALKKCREAVSKAQKELEKNIEKQQKDFDEQEENFKKQQENFEKNMDDFQKQIEEQQRMFQEEFQKQQEKFMNDFNFPFFG